MMSIWLKFMIAENHFRWWFFFCDFQHGFFL